MRNHCVKHSLADLEPLGNPINTNSTSPQILRYLAYNKYDFAVLETISLITFFPSRKKISF